MKSLHGLNSLKSAFASFKNISLATKITLGVTAAAAIIGAAAVISEAVGYTDKNAIESQVVASNNLDVNASSEDEKPQNPDRAEPKNLENSDRAADDEAGNDAMDESAQTSNSHNSTQSSDSPSSNPMVQPSNPSQPNPTPQPSKPAEPSRRPDYNLNDKYVVGNYGYVFYIFNASTQQCSVAEEKSFFAVVKFSGGNELFSATYPQYRAYAESKGYDLDHCGGMGSAPVTWEAVVEAGLALDEAKCAQYGLSCGRW